MSRLVLSNRQTARKISLHRLRAAASCLLDSLPAAKNLRVAVHLVDQVEMAALNHRFLDHHGSTDVLTFDYGRDAENKFQEGEIFISIADAILQGRRFHRPWHEETIRYLAHGLLHLLNFDDATPAGRREMKHHENRLLRAVTEKFPTARIEKTDPP